jgi:hypothetical protein
MTAPVFAISQYLHCLSEGYQPLLLQNYIPSRTLYFATRALAVGKKERRHNIALQAS